MIIIKKKKNSFKQSIFIRGSKELRVGPQLTNLTIDSGFADSNSVSLGKLYNLRFLEFAHLLRNNTI